MADTRVTGLMAIVDEMTNGRGDPRAKYEEERAGVEQGVALAFRVFDFLVPIIVTQVVTYAKSLEGTHRVKAARAEPVDGGF